MEEIHQTYLSSVSSRSGPSNALTASTLIDDTAPASSSAQETDSSAPKPKPPPQQRIQLLQASLAIGDISTSQYFLAKFPWTAQANPEIADLILRIVGHALEPVYRATLPGLDAYEASLDLDAGDLIPSTPSKTDKEVVPTLYAPSQPETSTKVFKFFYSAWRDELELWTTQEDIHEKGLRWLSLVRGMGGRANDIMVKICRIGVTHFMALRREKETSAGLSHGPKSRSEQRAVEVGSD